MMSEVPEKKDHFQKNLATPRGLAAENRDRVEGLMPNGVLQVRGLRAKISFITIAYAIVALIASGCGRASHGEGVTTRAWGQLTLAGNASIPLPAQNPGSVSPKIAAIKTAPGPTAPSNPLPVAKSVAVTPSGGKPGTSRTGLIIFASDGMTDSGGTTTRDFTSPGFLFSPQSRSNASPFATGSVLSKAQAGFASTGGSGGGVGSGIGVGVLFGARN